MAQITSAIASGETIDEVDERLIEPAQVDSDHKAALWLFGWSFMGHDYQRHLALEHLRQLEDEDVRTAS